MGYKAVACLALAVPLTAGEWDSKASVQLEQRTRYESRTGSAFGAAPDVESLPSPRSRAPQYRI